MLFCLTRIRTTALWPVHLEKGAHARVSKQPVKVPLNHAERGALTCGHVMSNFGPSPTPRLWGRALASPGVPDRRRRAGDVQAGGASGKQGSGKLGRASQEGVFQEGAFTERRRQDGLGLLPPARTPEQRYRRERANKVGGFVLVLIGSFVVGSSLALLGRQLGPEFGFSLTLGVLVLSQGLWLIGRRDRRRHDRRDRRR